VDPAREGRGECLSKENILSYLLWLYKKKGYSEAHLHTTVNALKFYFEKVEGRARQFYDLPWPKRPHKLPAILAEQEIVALIKSTLNLKYKTLLMAVNSDGLRVSELVCLKVTDFIMKAVSTV
jgi:site-specific recombinase XerD